MACHCVGGVKGTLASAISPERLGSGGLAAQFRERPDGVNKMLKAQGGSPFQSCGRSYNDDPIGGLETMTAVGNFFQDAI